MGRARSLAPARAQRVLLPLMVLHLLCSTSATSGETRCIRARQCSVAVHECISFVMAMPHKLRRGAKPSVADIADSEGFAVGDAQLEMSQTLNTTRDTRHHRHTTDHTQGQVNHPYGRTRARPRNISHPHRPIPHQGSTRAPGRRRAAQPPPTPRPAPPPNCWRAAKPASPWSRIGARCRCWCSSESSCWR